MDEPSVQLAFSQVLVFLYLYLILVELSSLVYQYSRLDGIENIAVHRMGSFSPLCKRSDKLLLGNPVTSKIGASIQRGYPTWKTAGLGLTLQYTCAPCYTHSLSRRSVSSHSRFEQVPSNPSNMMVGAALLALAIRLLPL